MSDFYHAIVDVEAKPDEAQPLAQEVVRRLVAEGIIQRDIDPEATLGGPGYRPGDRITELYELPPRHSPFWTLVTNGMQVCAERWVNQFGFTLLEALVCPRCGASYSWDDSVGKRFMDAVGEFYDGSDEPQVSCPACGLDSSAPLWHTKPHMGFAHLAFMFYNWPRFDSSSWKVDIPRLIGKTLHPSAA